MHPPSSTENHSRVLSSSSSSFLSSSPFSSSSPEVQHEGKGKGKYKGKGKKIVKETVNEGEFGRQEEVIITPSFFWDTHAADGEELCAEINRQREFFREKKRREARVAKNDISFKRKTHSQAQIQTQTNKQPQTEMHTQTHNRIQTQTQTPIQLQDVNTQQKQMKKEFRQG
jgi:hypothetical protein